MYELVTLLKTLRFLFYELKTLGFRGSKITILKSYLSCRYLRPEATLFRVELCTRFIKYT